MIALVKTGQDNGVPMRIINNVIDANITRKHSMVQKIHDALGGNVRSKVIAVLGVAFKPDTDDMRESPAIDIIKGLQACGAHIVAYDPQAMEQAEKLLPHVLFAEDAYDCVRNVNAVVIITEWDEFARLDLNHIKELMINPVMVDLRNIYIPEEVREMGFEYTSIGR